MNVAETGNQVYTTNSSRSTGLKMLGVILLLPALLLCLTELLTPTMRSSLLSLQAVDFFGVQGEFVVPLSLASLMSAQENGALNTFTGLISPTLFNVPVLFILTIFFLGQAPHWQRSSTDEASKSFVSLRYLVFQVFYLDRLVLYSEKQ